MKYLNFLISYVPALWGIVELTMTFLIKKDVKIEFQKSDNRILQFLSWVCTITGAFWGVYLIRNSISFLRSTSAFFPCAGVILMFVGLAIRLISILKLGKYFTMNITIQENHKLIKDGVYKYIRHPSYTGLIVILFGMSIIYGNLISFILVLFPLVIWIFKRIEAEERILLNHFGIEYEEYCKTTKRLIPFVY
jgi:protein-S-isoprenylcysteine O-methyltransferase Ste14